ncbi:hypothetical protein M408DRAFT_182831 [Serendipita vermifera MAFF 305830]|uniref:Uncharacterized protein n=1 Tax=Serendipita vermifera MAFF 305830 TaxID=933852 RepID=A0A0C3AHZ3_SERVB|nr:hypothetical protein M408DRAFT_182831 [Serendipita vermifera MAFF 305830]
MDSLFLIYWSLGPLMHKAGRTEDPSCVYPSPLHLCGGPLFSFHFLLFSFFRPGAPLFSSNPLLNSIF